VTDPTDRAQADRDQATTDRTQATTDRTQATTDRTQATSDRDQATADREQATTDRDQATSDRGRVRRQVQASNEDVAQLGRSVADLAQSVADLHDLILDTMSKAEKANVAADQASSVAARNPSRRTLGRVASAVLAVALVLAGTGAWVLHRQQAQAYRACMKRNAAQAETTAFLGRLDAAVKKSQREGSLLARNLGSLLTPPAGPVVTCRRPSP